MQASAKAEKTIRLGHPWIYDTEVSALPGAGFPADGQLCDVQSPKGSYLGTGFYNSHSKIRVRLISRSANDTFDEAFWERRLRYAYAYRKAVMRPDICCCRLIFGEADQFPGLTVDRFGSLLVTQTLSLGMEKIKSTLFPLLVKIFGEDGQKIDAIYERNDETLRDKEGLPQSCGFFPLWEYADKLGGVKVLTRQETEKLPSWTKIRENGLTYEVDYQTGQKTGFFLDQKYNRLAVSRLAKGLRVLDCFTDTGSFALNAAKGGALSVTAVDVSESSLEVGRRNAAGNGFSDIITFEQADVFDLLPRLEQTSRRAFDLIILDPPAFTKSRRTIASAEKGYKEINYRAMKILPRGGYLATCSCSHFMSDELFRKMLWSAALDAGVELRQIEARQQAPDHPILWNVPETNYLKFYLFQVI